MEKTIINKVRDTKTLTLQAFLDDYTFNTLKDANKRDVTKLKNAMRKRGWTSPVFTWQKFVVDGTGRRKAVVELLEEGYTFPEGIPYVEVEAKDMAEAKQLALDFSSQHGYITQDSFLEYTADFEVDFETMQIAGFDKDRFIETDENDDDVPEIPEEPKSKLGDLYELGSHRVLCGDSTKVEDVEKLMEGKKADMVFTDPPYGIDYQDVAHKHTKIEGDNSLDNIENLMVTTLLNDCPMYVCCNWKCYSAFEKAMIGAGKEPKSCIVWDKETRIQNLDKFYKQHEFILYHGLFGGQKTLTGDVWRMKRQVRGDHPTSKPVELVAQAITYTVMERQIVQDLFLGSGSTLIASEKTGRVCYGMELDPKYVDVIISRYVEFTGNNKIKKNGQEIIWEIKK